MNGAHVHIDDRLAYFGAGNTGDANPEVVGAKAANLMHLAEAGLPVPPGFVLDIQECGDFYAAGGGLAPDICDVITRGIRYIEAATDKRFGASRRPLLVAVRSGAAVSMPGMLDTILNIGVCDATLPALLRASGDPRFVWDLYRRLIQSYAEVVDSCSPEAFAATTADVLVQHDAPVVSELDVAGLRELVAKQKDLYGRVAGRPFPQDPYGQLLGAVEAVMRSWNSDRAVEYRRIEGLSGLVGTAVTVQAMVFGNLGLTSGSGVGFTRDPATGHNRLYVDFMLNAQGEDVVAGRESATQPEPLIAAIPGLASQLESARQTLERIYHDVQDFEFTVEEGKLWLLQTRAAQRTPLAALQIACDLVDEGLIDISAARQRLDRYDLDRITCVQLSAPPGTEPLGCATPASGGVASGRIALDVDAALRSVEQGQPVVLVRSHASTEDIAALAVCRGLLTAAGARTSHAAVVARRLGVVCLINCPELSVDLDARRIRLGDHERREMDVITLDATAGYIYDGALELVELPPVELINRVRSWQDSEAR